MEQPVPVKERYRCDECGLRLTADEVRWSEKGRALCPRCEWPLDPPGTPAALPPAGTEPGTCSECGLVIAEDEVRWSSDGRSLCPRCEFPLGPVRKRAN